VALVKVADVDVGPHLEYVRHRLTGEHHVGEDRQSVFLAEGSPATMSERF
jgi:hypothetical protein